MLSIQKVNIATLYNRNEEYKSCNRETDREDGSKIQKFKELLHQNIIPINELLHLAWSGVPSELRSTVWRLLLKYQSPNRDANFTIIERKRSVYFGMCDIYFAKNQQYDEREKKILKQISEDVKRTIPDSSVFRNLQIQTLLERILFIWNIRNPACGYVQGMNDIVAPFLVVFLSDYVDIDTTKLQFINEKQLNHLDQRLIRQVEADSYWCLCKLLESVLDNYTNSQPGLIRFYNKFKEILQALDKKLYEHLTTSLSMELYAFIFKWSTCMLLRMFQFEVGLRLFDTLLAEENNYFELCLFIIISILMKFSLKIQKLQYDEIMILLEKIPTREWSESDLSLCLSEAYAYQRIFSKK
ncbi:unnamed protein product [Paramecium primaurelia]|uniref:Rab-GAP TBC domain-containing protein n=1 Tax=Paramecium primaurelia TaxID=5886 RepID=A0A8S1MRA9_PARPR|nr:unnamed protein product [Paramecium primaurelia]